MRSTPKDFSTRYPNVKLTHGTWDDSEILKKAAADADITIQCGNSDHLGAVSALLEGAASPKDGKKRFYIHLSGTGILADFADKDAKEWRGKLNPKVYNDLEGVEEILNRHDGTPHRHTDKIIQEAGEKYADRLGTAIVCPPDIYGKGSGPVKVESVYFPAFIGEARKVGATFYYGKGENKRGWTHVQDVVQVFTLLTEQAALGGGSATWGREGYFLATSTEASQKELAAKVGKLLHEKGVLSTAEPKQVDEAVIQEALSDWGYDGLGWYMFGGNSRAEPRRAAEELGWKPQGKGLWEELEGDIDLALASGHTGWTKLGKQ